MATVTELKRWLDTLPVDSEIVIDGGGLALMALDENGEEIEGIYLELGNQP